METSEIVKRMVEDLRDIIRNEEAWAIGERYKGTIEEQYEQFLIERGRKEVFDAGSNGKDVT
jgi:hypothetical protein